MDINLLVKLSSRAWSLKILALLHEGVPGRQAPLLAAAGASRTTFAHSLTHLVELGILERTPGHGHPLRPEYRLTEAGEKIAPIAYRIETTAGKNTGAILIRKTWTVPILAVAKKPMLFSELKKDLGSITDRALSQSLRDLNAQNWVSRSVKVESFPPRPYYQVINEGLKISQEIGLTG